MTKFVVGVPVATEVPTVLVEAELKPGAHRFRLVVVRDDGRESPPDEAIVQVTQSIGAVAVAPRPARRKRK